MAALIEPGEKIDDLIDEAKALTFEHGVEVAIISLKDGSRVMVKGGSGGIAGLEELGTKRVIAHTHPYGQSGPVVPSASDEQALRALGQTHSYILERGKIQRFRAK